MLLQLIQPSQEEKARRLSKVTFLLHYWRMNTGPGFWRSVGEGRNPGMQAITKIDLRVTRSRSRTLVKTVTGLV